MDGSITENAPKNHIWERGAERNWKLWVLIQANRWGLVLFGSLGTFVFLLALARWGPTSAAKLVQTDNIPTLFSSIVGSMITTVTLILTVTQLVLSEEIGSLADQQRRLDGQSDFREQVEETLDVDISPAEPADFFRALIVQTKACAETLQDAAEADESAAGGELARFAADVVEHSDQVLDELEGARFGTFTVISAVLDYNYSRKIHDARQFRERNRKSFTDETNAALIRLIEVLRYFGPTRGFFKSIYFQWELINVSRSMVYATLPGLAISGYMILLFDPTKLVSHVFSISLTYVVACGAFVVALVPFLLLLVYVLRVLTILKRTIAPGGFILRSTDWSEPGSWRD